MAAIMARCWHSGRAQERKLLQLARAGAGMFVYLLLQHHNALPVTAESQTRSRSQRVHIKIDSKLSQITSQTSAQCLQGCSIFSNFGVYLLFHIIFSANRSLKTRPASSLHLLLLFQCKLDEPYMWCRCSVVPVELQACQKSKSGAQIGSMT